MEPVLVETSEYEYRQTLLRKAGNGRAVIAQPVNVADDRFKLSDREAMAEIFAVPSHAGPPVSVASALLVTSVYACCSLIANAIACMPLNFYRREGDGDGRKRIKPDLWWLFNEQPSPLLSAAVFWQYIITTKLLHGDGFALLVRDRNGKITEVLPLSPLDVQVQRENDYLMYFVNSPDLGMFGVHQDDMLHFPGFGFNPHGNKVRSGRGMSIIQQAARQAIGNALAADQFSGRFFQNGAQPSHTVMFPAGVTDEQIDSLRNKWAERYSGVQNAGKPIILTYGATVKELTMTMEDAQLLETRRFQVEDIARAFGVPPFMIGSTDKTTSWGSGVEHMGQGFLTFTLTGHLTPAEQEINRKCFRTATYFAEFNVDGLQRADLKARGDYYRQAIGGPSLGPGWLSANEIRQKENEEPAAGGESLYTPPPAAAGGAGGNGSAGKDGKDAGGAPEANWGEQLRKDLREFMERKQSVVLEPGAITVNSPVTIQAGAVQTSVQLPEIEMNNLVEQPRVTEEVLDRDPKTHEITRITRTVKG